MCNGSNCDCDRCATRRRAAEPVRELDTDDQQLQDMADDAGR